MQPSLREMGRLSAELYPAQLADRLSEPVLTQWDAWGNRVDRIELTPLWRTAERIAAEHGVVATAYERAHGRFSRIHQFALAYLFTPSTDIYACPLAMTDGAARVLLDSGNRALIDRAVPAPHQPRPGRVLDQRAVDDGDHRRLRRGAQRRRRRGRTRTADGGCTAASGSPPPPPRRWR